MKKTALVIVLLTGLIAMSFRITERNEDPQWKNLKILPKNITKTQLDSVMKHYTLALGVKCNFCHVRPKAGEEWDYASDGNKHKLIAREMMTMTQKINDKHFEVANTKGLDAKLMVTCLTCHNGHPEPATLELHEPKPEQNRNGNRLKADSIIRN
jgi:hypothetical protein